MVQVPLEEILTRVENVYEAVIIAAKEARRINEQRLVEQEHVSDDEEVVEEEEGEEESELNIDERKEAKVTVQALQRLIDGRIAYSYEEEKDR